MSMCVGALSFSIASKQVVMIIIFSPCSFGTLFQALCFSPSRVGNVLCVKSVAGDFIELDLVHRALSSVNNGFFAGKHLRRTLVATLLPSCVAAGTELCCW